MFNVRPKNALCMSPAPHAGCPIYFVFSLIDDQRAFDNESFHSSMNDSVQTKAEAIQAVYDISAMNTSMIEAQTSSIKIFKADFC